MVQVKGLHYEIIGVYVYNGQVFLNINEFGSETTSGSSWINFSTVSKENETVKKHKTRK